MAPTKTLLGIVNPVIRNVVNVVDNQIIAMNVQILLQEMQYQVVFVK